MALEPVAAASSALLCPPAHHYCPAGTPALTPATAPTAWSVKKMEKVFLSLA
jgi:hypothetical protein